MAGVANVSTLPAAQNACLFFLASSRSSRDIPITDGRACEGWRDHVMEMSAVGRRRTAKFYIRDCIVLGSLDGSISASPKERIGFRCSLVLVTVGGDLFVMVVLFRNVNFH